MENKRVDYSMYFARICRADTVALYRADCARSFSLRNFRVLAPLICGVVVQKIGAFQIACVVEREKREQSERREKFRNIRVFRARSRLSRLILHGAKTSWHVLLYP